MFLHINKVNHIDDCWFRSFAFLVKGPDCNLWQFAALFFYHQYMIDNRREIMLPGYFGSAVLWGLTLTAVNNRDVNIRVFLCCFAYKRLPAVSLHIFNYLKPYENRYWYLSNLSGFNILNCFFGYWGEIFSENLEDLWQRIRM